ncbi:MAG: PRD domain-containing protein [Micropruina sp.]|uniref:PRD domain-containing protein n=1 Tax=Micropruina sp. TaxID=2737536 RepID=UPI0039E31956
MRIHNHKQLDSEPTSVGNAIRDAFPDAADVAVRLSGVLELRLGAALTPDEIAYLALHVARVTSER